MNQQRIVPLESYVKNPSLGQTSNYMFLNGTSMAAGATSGAVAALLTSKDNEDLTPDQIKARLMKTATKTFPRTSVILGQLIQYDIFTVGAGYLDLDAAIKSDLKPKKGKRSEDTRLNSSHPRLSRMPSSA